MKKDSGRGRGVKTRSTKQYRERRCKDEMKKDSGRRRVIEEEMKKDS